MANDKLPESQNPDWVEDYRRQRSKYETFTAELKALIQKLIDRKSIHAVIESRTKEVASFAGKIARPGKSYSNPLVEMTDLSGIRIIVNSLGEVDQVAKIIKSEFNVDEPRSINKSEALEVDRFGYLSQHFIVTILSARKVLTEWAEMGSLCAEIQLRTALQHTWSTVQHPLDYKSAVEIPKPLRRRLFRLSALFELADEELDTILNEAREIRGTYAAAVQNKSAHIDINLDSLKVYIHQSVEFSRWDRYWNSIPNVKTEEAYWTERDVAMPLLCGINDLFDYERLLESSHGWGEKYVDDALLDIRQDPSRLLSTTRNGILLYLLIGNFPNVLNAEILRNQFAFGNADRIVHIAKKWNPQFTNITASSQSHTP